MMYRPDPLEHTILRVLELQDPRPQNESWMSRQLKELGFKTLSLKEQRAATKILADAGLIAVTKRIGAHGYVVLTLTDAGRKAIDAAKQEAERTA